MASTRRLTAILAADVAGYSRLMGADEEGTLERLKAVRQQLIDPKIAEHHGRIVKTTGDGLLTEFASVVDAVRCAAEVQRGMLDREPEANDERRIRLRIGVNLGDVIADGDDIFGDGVNVAARLEALAEPGGICISRTVRDHIRDKLPFPFEDKGEQSVKNIARPVRVYALRSEAVAELPVSSPMSATSMSQPAGAPRLSIVVLPFANLSNDPDQGYFADGITEDLTTDLSRIGEMLVISRNTAFTYRNKSIDTKQIGRELGVRYVLEGSVRRSGDKVRVTAQLIDAESDTHLWAERFDGDTSDLFALQDEITSRIAVTLNVELIAAAAAQVTDNPQSLEYFLRGRAAGAKPKTRVNHAEAIALYEHALALDRHSVAAQSRLAAELAGRVLNNMTDSRDADIARAEELAEQALTAEPRGMARALRKGSGLARAGAVCRSDSRVRNGHRAQPQSGVCNILPRPMQVLYRVAGGLDRTPGAIHSLEPARSPRWDGLYPNRRSISAAIAVERRDRLARKGMSQPPGASASSRPSRFCLCPRRRGRTRRRRTRRSPEAERRRQLFEHRPYADGPLQKFHGAEGPRLVRSHLRSRPTQGGGPGRMTATRRLAAILAADVAGYSRLMGADEEGTHERLKAVRRQLVDPKIKEHQGRIVKTTGDGLLAEFPSVVDAVRCAAEVQRAMIDREPEATEDRQLRFRIGINLGDVMIDRDDIFGDGVNIAARLEALAEPGGICVSRTVRDHIRDKLPYPLEDRGEQSVKNIARPVHVYALRPGAVADLPTATSRAPSISQPPVAPRLSIVVLPFTNLSNDPEDLTTDLSRIEGSFVISRNTAFTYRGKPIDTKQIGHELGVRYVLEGSVRRSGNQVRVNAQLIDAETNAHLWAERFDRDAGDLFALQDEITSRIAVALNLELVGAEAVRPTDHLEVLDYILRGRAAMYKPAARESYAEAISLFERALAVDPDSVDAQSWFAITLVRRVLNFGSSSAEADIKRAEELATKAVAASPRSALAHDAKGDVLRVLRRCAEAIPEYETALALNRNSVSTLAAIGRCKIYIGPIEQAIPAQEQAIRLSPRDPGIALWYNRLGEAHLLQSRTDEAIPWLEKARSANAALPFVHAWLASAYALKGDTERASAELADARRLGGEGSYANIARMRANTRYENPIIRALAEATFYAGLRKAGMPEE
jgi:adenylate cyclase